MYQNNIIDALRIEAIAALMKAEQIDLKDKSKVINSLKETVAAKANIECYLKNFSWL